MKLNRYTNTESIEVLPKSRINWIDVLKGVGIIAVVWGHSGHPYAYLMFLFHMPLFFFLSGYLYNSNDNRSWLKYVGEKSKHLLVPYIFYLFLITAVLFVFSYLKDLPLVVNWKALFLGGSLLEGVYGTFWFVTCLFFVQIFYELLYRILRSKRLLIIILIGCYSFAFWESRFYEDFFFPWNMDVALFAIIFYALGHTIKTKRWLENTRKRTLILISSVLFIIPFLYLYFWEIIRFGIDLKHRQYYFFGTGIIVPMTIIILLAGLCIGLANWNFARIVISSLGKSSMSIMYLHLISNYLASQYIAITPVRFLIIGILLPWLWYIFISYIPGLQLLAFGSYSKLSRRSSVIPSEHYTLKQ